MAHPIFHTPLPETDIATKRETVVYQIVPTTPDHNCSEETFTKYSGNHAEVLTLKRAGISDDGQPISGSHISVCSFGHLSANVTLCKNCGLPCCPKEIRGGLCPSCARNELIMNLVTSAVSISIKVITESVKGLSKITMPFLWD